jgi:hypothetical protein
MRVAWASFISTAAAGLFTAPVQAQLAAGYSEHIAIAGLEPLVSGCLPPNVRVQFEPSDIRLSLAETLYECSRVASAVQEGKR